MSGAYGPMPALPFPIQGEAAKIGGGVDIVEAGAGEDAGVFGDRKIKIAGDGIIPSRNVHERTDVAADVIDARLHTDRSNARAERPAIGEAVVEVDAFNRCVGGFAGRDFRIERRSACGFLGSS